MYRTPKMAGYLTAVGPGTQVEGDTITCSHCSSVVVVRSTDPTMVTDIGGGCRMCGKHICGPCADKGGCDPFIKQVERQLERGRSREAL